MRRVSSFTTKLTALLGIPLAVLVVVAGLGVLHASDGVARSRSTSKAVELSLAAANAARQLSREGDLSASLVAAAAESAATPLAADQPDATGDGPEDQSSPAPGSDPSTAAAPLAGGGGAQAAQARTSEELTFQRKQTDETVKALQSIIEDGSEAAQVHMGGALDGLQRLDTARAAVDQRRPGTSEVVGSYADITEPVLSVERLLQGTHDVEITARIDAHLALTRAIQTIARQESLISAMLTAHRADPAVYQTVVGLGTSERHWLDAFENTASTEELDSYSEAEALPAVTTAQRLRDTALAAGPGGTPEGDAAIWSKTVNRRLDQLEVIADDSVARLEHAAAARRSAASGRRLFAVVLFLGALALTAGLLFGLCRLIVSPVRRLADAGRTAREKSIPRALELAESDGEQVARAALTPLPTCSSDELRVVAEAFNELQERAVSLVAAGEAGRSDVNSVFLHFGQRTQNLVTHQLSHIDSLEARTDNPDTLADLFLLDHLATRLRRNAESLVVLAGADSPRPWSRPVSVVNVVRAAVAEAADYSRVDLLPMGNAMVMGACANDVSHLLAELVDNALAFSTPDSRVRISGEEQVGGHYLVSIADAGRGMSARQMAETNERINRTPVADVGASRYFGLFVVGRLAQRHGISVRLAPSRVEGVTAEVLLPPSLLVGAWTPNEAAPIAATAGSLAGWPDG
jgi:signal transduction histidine kinase